MQGLFSCLAQIVKHYTPESYWTSGEGKKYWDEYNAQHSDVCLGVAERMHQSINEALAPQQVSLPQVTRWCDATGLDAMTLQQEFPITDRNSVWRFATQGKSVFNKPRERKQPEESWN